MLWSALFFLSDLLWTYSPNVFRVFVFFLKKCRETNVVFQKHEKKIIHKRVQTYCSLQNLIHSHELQYELGSCENFGEKHLHNSSKMIDLTSWTSPMVSEFCLKKTDFGKKHCSLQEYYLSESWKENHAQIVYRHTVVFKIWSCCDKQCELNIVKILEKNICATLQKWSIWKCRTLADGFKNHVFIRKTP